MRLLWSYTYTVMHLTYQYQRQGAVWEAYFTSDKIPPVKTKLNGSIHNVSSVIKKMVTSAAESEVGACFQNAQTAAALRITLIELGHKQAAAPLRTDNSTDYRILNETIKQKRSKSMDIVNTSGKAGAQIPQLPLGDDSSPWGR
jgi:hypothetical protein